MTAADLRPRPQCDGTAVNPLPRYSTGQWRIVQCCGFVFLHNPPDYERLVSDFAWEKTSAAETIRRAEARPVLTRIDHSTRWRLNPFRQGRQALYRSLFKPGAVLDVGCAAGRSVPKQFVPYGCSLIIFRQSIAFFTLLVLSGIAILLAISSRDPLLPLHEFVFAALGLLAIPFVVGMIIGAGLVWALRALRRALVHWYGACTADGTHDTRKFMIVGPARRLLVVFRGLVERARSWPN